MCILILVLLCCQFSDLSVTVSYAVFKDIAKITVAYFLLVVISVKVPPTLPFFLVLFLFFLGLRTLALHALAVNCFGIFCSYPYSELGKIFKNAVYMKASGA